jgi:hypothetical protein
MAAWFKISIFFLGKDSEKSGHEQIYQHGRLVGDMNYL